MNRLPTMKLSEVMLILNIWSVETPGLQGVWQGHPRHADHRKVSKHKRPSTRKYLAGPLCAHPTGRPSFLTQNPWVSRAGWQVYKSTPTSEGHASGVPN
jgi:hypothetical protein